MSNDKYFENKLVLKQQKRSFLVFIIISSLVISSIFFFTYFQNSPSTPDELPKINILCEEKLNNEDFRDCEFELISDDESERIIPMKARIKVRGSFNAKMPKKGYRIELSSPKSLLGLRKDDDWQLFALFLDLSNVRIKLSFDLYRSLLPINPTTILPNSHFVCLYINGEYQGLYLLSEKNDRRLFGFDDAKNDISSSLIFQAGARRNDLKNYKYSDWSQDWPNEDEGIYIMDDIMTELSGFISYTSESEFFNSSTGIYSRFNKLNLIDFYLFNYFILHKDFWGQNYFLVRDTVPNLFYLVPWDFDPSFGQYLGRKYSSSEDPTREIFQRNYLYYRLLNNEEFIIEVKKRWFFLRQTIWTEEFILDMVTDIYDDIKAISEIDSKMWYSLIFENDWEYDIKKSVKYLYEWISERLDFCDSFFEYS